MEKQKLSHNDYIREHELLESLQKETIEKNQNNLTHIKSLEKSLKTEHDELVKSQTSFKEYKQKHTRQKKILLSDKKKLTSIVNENEKLIERLCYKLALFKDKLSQFEIPVFDQYLLLISPNDKELWMHNGQNNLRLNYHRLFYKKHKQSYIDYDNYNMMDSDENNMSNYNRKKTEIIIDKNQNQNQNQNNNIKSFEKQMNNNTHDDHKAKNSKMKQNANNDNNTKDKRAKNKSNHNNSNDEIDMNVKIDDDKNSENNENNENNDSDSHVDVDDIDDSNNSNLNILTKYAQLLLIKYAGTHELYLVVNKRDDNNDQVEMFRQDFADCRSIRKCENVGEFRIEFDKITLHFYADSYEQCDKIVIILRQFLEQHSLNNLHEPSPPPDNPVTDSMAIFFGA